MDKFEPWIHDADSGPFWRKLNKLQVQGGVAGPFVRPRCCQEELQFDLEHKECSPLALKHAYVAAARDVNQERRQDIRDDDSVFGCRGDEIDLATIAVKRQRRQ